MINPQQYRYLLRISNRSKETDFNELTKFFEKFQSNAKALVSNDPLQPSSSKSDTFQADDNDYNTLQQALTTYDGMDRLQELDLTTEQTSQLLSNIEYLRSILPPSKSESLFGIRDIPPPRFAKSKFLRAYEVLTNPLVVFKWADKNDLQFSDVDNLRQFYPNLYDFAVAGLTQALVAKNQTQTTTMPLARQRLVAMLLNAPRLTPDILNRLQASYTTEQEPLEPQNFNPKSTPLATAKFQV